MAKARPSSAEIDRFLEEVNRRKQQQAKKTAPPPVVQREQPKPKVQAQPRPVRVQQKQVMDEPIMRAVVLETMPEPIREPATRQMTSAYQLPIAPIQVPRGTESVPILHAKALIKSRDGMRAMFVLNEIMSPPRCKQPYRR